MNSAPRTRLKCSRSCGIAYTLPWNPCSSSHGTPVHHGLDYAAGASFTSVGQLKVHMGAFIETYNIDAEPFVWTKSKVYQRRVKGRRLRDL